MSKRYVSVLERARTHIRQALEESLAELFDHRQISYRLINDKGEGLLDAIAELMGPEQFSGSLLSRYRFTAGCALSGRLVSMNSRMMEVCYPTTQIDEVGHLLAVFPPSEFNSYFNPSKGTVSLSKLKPHIYAHILPPLQNLGELKVVANVERCSGIGSIELCKLTAQPARCQQGRWDRERCRSTEEKVCHRYSSR
ncbi:hypothetical protein Aduo_006903 [Ancylostoma duodenale]